MTLAAPCQLDLQEAGIGTKWLLAYRRQVTGSNGLKDLVLSPGMQKSLLQERMALIKEPRAWGKAVSKFLWHLSLVSRGRETTQQKAGCLNKSTWKTKPLRTSQTEIGVLKDHLTSYYDPPLLLPREPGRSTLNIISEVVSNHSKTKWNISRK